MGDSRVSGDRTGRQQKKRTKDKPCKGADGVRKAKKKKKKKKNKNNNKKKKKKATRLQKRRSRSRRSW